jgi:pyrroloquinoline quinone biosynthesis protein D
MNAPVRVETASVPKLPRHVKFRFDETRQKWILLAPERLLLPDETAVAILERVDGARSVGDIVAALAAAYDAPAAEIETDVIAMLQDLADKGFVVDERRPG